MKKDRPKIIIHDSGELEGYMSKGRYMYKRKMIQVVALEDYEKLEKELLAHAFKAVYK